MVEVAKSATSSKASRPAAERLVEGQPDRGQLGVGVGRPRQRAVVGRDGFAARHADGQLALVVGLVRVQLRARRVADQLEAIADAQPTVVGQRHVRDEADRLEPQAVERKGPADGQQLSVALGAWSRRRAR